MRASRPFFPGRVFAAQGLAANYFQAFFTIKFQSFNLFREISLSPVPGELRQNFRFSDVFWAFSFFGGRGGQTPNDEIFRESRPKSHLGQVPCVYSFFSFFLSFFN